MKWLRTVFYDDLIEEKFPREQSIERVCWGYSRKFRDSISIFCDSSGIELQVSFTLDSSQGRVPKAVALLSIIYRGEEGNRLLFAKESDQTDHEELAFMLKYLSLFTKMWCGVENYFDQLHRLEKRVIALEKYYESLK